MYDSQFYARQLQWLHDTLLNAERNGEKVHILAHMPAATGGMFKVYAREYQRIVERFWNTISAQFNGHTHRDTFNVFYARSSPRDAVNVAWNGGSATSYSNVNPNYRLYSVETETYVSDILLTRVFDYNFFISFSASNGSRNMDLQFNRC